MNAKRKPLAKYKSLKAFGIFASLRLPLIQASFFVVEIHPYFIKLSGIRSVGLFISLFFYLRQRRIRALISFEFKYKNMIIRLYYHIRPSLCAVDLCLHKLS